MAAESYEAVTGLNLDPDIAYRVRPAAEVAQHEVAAGQTSKRGSTERPKSDSNAVSCNSLDKMINR